MTQPVRRILAAEVRVARLGVFIEMGPIAMLPNCQETTAALHRSRTEQLLLSLELPLPSCTGNPRLFAGSLLRI